MALEKCFPMKQWLDFIPLFAFFATFKTLGIFPATAVLIGSSVLVYGAIWLKDRHLENGQKVTPSRPFYLVA